MSPDDAVTHLRREGVSDPFVAFSPQSKTWHVHSQFGLLGVGPTLREALAAAGHPAPAVSHFGTHGKSVTLGNETVAVAKSSTFARRISNALNAYTPDSRGT